MDGGLNDSASYAYLDTRKTIVDEQIKDQMCKTFFKEIKEQRQKAVKEFASEIMNKCLEQDCWHYRWIDVYQFEQLLKERGIVL